jgi:hypothetical protein
MTCCKSKVAHLPFVLQSISMGTVVLIHRNWNTSTHKMLKILFFVAYALKFCSRALEKKKGLLRHGIGRQDSAFDIATGYGLGSRRGPCSSPGRGDVQTGSRAHPASLPWGLRGRSIKLTTHLQLMLRLTNTWIYTFTPPYVFMA